MTTNDNTSAPPLDLDAIEARASRVVTMVTAYLDAAGDDADPDAADDAIRERSGARDTLALVACVRELEARAGMLRAQLDEAHSNAAGLRRAAWRIRERASALRCDLLDARREGAEAMREAAAEECEVRAVERGSNELQYAANAIRALPLPEAPR